MTTDPMEPLKIVAQRAIDALAELGLHTQNIAFLPNMEGGPNFCQIIVALDDAAVAGAVEDDTQKKADADILKEMERGMLKEKEQEKADAAAEGLRRLQQELEGGKGILGDDK